MKNYEGYADEELIGLLRQGESDITDYLMEKYKPLVRKKANAMFLIGGENEDLIQEGMIGLFKALRDYRVDRDSSFYHFAELCIQRQLYTAIEVSNRKKNMPLNTYVSMSTEEGEDLSYLEQFLTDDETNPENLVVEREFRENLFRLLEEQLSEMERRVLMMYLGGCDYIQIAERLGRPVKSVDNALQRIRQKIRVLGTENGSVR